MNRFWLPLGGFALLCVMFAVALKRADDPERQFPPSMLLGKPAPDFLLPDLLNPGSDIDSRQFRGRWVLINAWGTWCPTCRAEHKQLLAIKDEGKVAIVGLDFNDEDDKARQWLSELGNPYTAVAADHDSRSAVDYGVYLAPESFLVNPQGIVVHKVSGEITPELWRDKLLPLIDGAAK